jgi:hypothetical protein
MNILNQVLTNLPIRKTQATFLNLLCALILAIPGRINYKNLERFSFLTLRAAPDGLGSPPNGENLSQLG